MLKETEFELSPSDALGSQSGYGGFSFGCAMEPTDGKVRLVNAVHSCREGLMSHMRARINGGTHAQPTDKMRMIFSLVSTNSAQLKENEAWMERAIPVLQAFDRIAGWPLTRVYKIKTKHNDWLRAYYTHSSRRWMKSSYLVSLYTLLVRMCKDDRIKGFKDFDGLCKVVDKILKAAASNSQLNLKFDHSYVRDSRPYWEAVMKGYPRLFRQMKMEHYWDTSKVGGRTGTEGIQYLVSGSTNYTEIRQELIKIKKELAEGTFNPAPAKKKK